jgi:indolepyruvate ferredoxin oxidoreductase beta subunit
VINKYEIMIVGTGGQGVLSVGSLLEQAAKFSGFDKVIGGEIHGLAQRGGSLSKYVRMGEDVFGPVIPLGNADVIICTELVESLRYLDHLSEDGSIVISETTIPSFAMWAAGIEYPDTDKIAGLMKNITDNVTIVNTQDIATKAGNILASNVVLLGVTSSAVSGFPITTESLKEAIKLNFRDRERLIDVNIKAFEMGINTVKS